jgi:hypothetical protein
MKKKKLEEGEKQNEHEMKNIYSTAPKYENFIKI